MDRDRFFAGLQMFNEDPEHFTYNIGGHEVSKDVARGLWIAAYGFEASGYLDEQREAAEIRGVDLEEFKWVDEDSERRTFTEGD